MHLSSFLALSVVSTLFFVKLAVMLRDVCALQWLGRLRSAHFVRSHSYSALAPFCSCAIALRIMLFDGSEARMPIEKAAEMVREAEQNLQPSAGAADQAPRVSKSCRACADRECNGCGDPRSLT